MEKTKNELKLFPNYFKKIGLGIILLTILILIIIKIFFRDSDFNLNHKSAISIIAFDFLLIGIFIICLTREKIEDERIIALRTQSMGFSFLFGIGFTVIMPFIHLILGEPIEFPESRQLIFMMLGWYALYFFGRKKSF